MPAKNSVKIYVSDGIYHIYNRGVEKRNIFLDDHDYTVFLHFLKEALLPPPHSKTLQQAFTLKGSTFKGIPRQPKNFHDSIELLAFCLMPNHFHMLVRQKYKDTIKKFLQSIAVRYSMYFNKTHKRVGSLFQGIYKAALVTEEPYFLHVTRYIHLNPREVGHDKTYSYCSYPDYLGKRQTPWLHPEVVLSFFQPGTFPFIKKHHTYEDFVEDFSQDSSEFLGGLTLEDPDL